MSNRPIPADQASAARTNVAARDRFLTYLNSSLNVVDDTCFWLFKPGEDDTEKTAFLSCAPLAVALPSDQFVYLSATISFVFVDHPDRPKQKKVSTTRTVHSYAMDKAMNDEIVAWHWNIDTSGNIPRGHIHVGRKADTENVPEGFHLPKLHIPTGRISFEEVLLFGICELGVQPEGDRDEAIAQLQQNLEVFERYRSSG